jgi:hypothetical protein
MAETTSPKTLVLLYLRRMTNASTASAARSKRWLSALGRIEREVVRLRTGRRPKAIPPARAPRR